MFQKATLITALIMTSFAPLTSAKRCGDFSVDILIDGRPVQMYEARGTTYIEARQNLEYAVRLTNHSARRVAIALSIDGLNSIDAKATTAHDASKWVLDPWESITVDGWQTSSQTARRFFFTSEEHSYGQWLGETQNLGVISAAVFHEYRPRPEPPERHRDRGLGSKRRRSIPIPDPTPDEPRPHHEERADGSDDLAATGIGQEIENPVRRVRFETEESPTATFRIRYEYRPQLIQLGLLKAPIDDLGRREQARGFDDFEFAPDPYRAK